MDGVKVIMMNLPGRIKGFTKLKDGYYTIILNDSLSDQAKRMTYKHEISHIINDDFYSEEPVDKIEAKRHEGCEEDGVLHSQR